MDHEEYQLRFHEAMAKAFAAKASNVRAAYFDLASFYHEKLGNHDPIFPSNDDLRLLAARADRQS